MTVYMINLAIVYSFSYLSRVYGRPAADGNGKWKVARFPLFIAVISLVLTSGLRYYVGTDYLAYSDIYNRVAKNGQFFSDIEIGFNAFLWLLSFVSKDPSFMFFVTSLIINLFIVMAIKNHAEPFELGMFLYITTYTFYSSFNGIRQSIAMAVLFWAVKFVIEKNFKKYLIAVVLISFVHNSAIILLPVYFIAQNRFKSLRNIALTTFFIGGYIFYVSFVESLFYFLSDTKYAHYKTWLVAANDGANIWRLFVMASVLAMALIFYNKLKEINKEIDVFLNFYFIGFLIMLLSLKNWLFARVADYFIIYGIIFIPSLARIFDRAGNTIIKVILMLCFFLYSYFLLLSNESDVLPYRTIFSL